MIFLFNFFFFFIILFNSNSTIYDAYSDAALIGNRRSCGGAGPNACARIKRDIFFSLFGKTTRVVPRKKRNGRGGKINSTETSERVSRLVVIVFENAPSSKDECDTNCHNELLFIVSLDVTVFSAHTHTHNTPAEELGCLENSCSLLSSARFRRNKKKRKK